MYFFERKNPRYQDISLDIGDNSLCIQLFSLFPLMEAPGHTAIDFPVSAVGTVEGPFQFKPQTPVVAELSRDACADIVPGVMIRLIVANPFQAIYRGQIKSPVAGKFMKDVGFKIPRCIGVDVFAQAEA